MVPVIGVTHHSPQRIFVVPLASRLDGRCHSPSGQALMIFRCTPVVNAVRAFLRGSGLETMAGNLPSAL